MKINVAIAKSETTVTSNLKPLPTASYCYKPGSIINHYSLLFVKRFVDIPCINSYKTSTSIVNRVHLKTMKTVHVMH